MFTGLTDGEDQDCTGERPQPGGPDPSSIQMSVSYTENALLYIDTCLRVESSAWKYVISLSCRLGCGVMTTVWFCSLGKMVIKN